MIESYKGRTVHEGMEVFAYRNLHRDMWSLKDWRTGLVIGHADELCLERCSFKVSEAGRQRVIRTGRKTVHAGIVGTIAPHEKVNGVRVTYNPHRAGYFHLVDEDGTEGSIVGLARRVHLGSDGRAYV